MKKYIILFVLICSGLLVKAQEVETPFYMWEINPKFAELSETEKAYNEVILFDLLTLEYTFQHEELICYRLQHRAIWVNSDEAIQRNNRIYLPLANESDIVKQKARVITKEGKIIELTDGAIKEAVDEESQQRYRYFALEGVDKGSIIEYYTVFKQPAYYTGAREVFQGDVFRKEVEFKLISPLNLLFSTMSYNGFPTMKPDSTVQYKNVLVAKTSNVIPLKEELFATYAPHLMYVVYKLDQNLETGRKNMISYENASQFIYEQTHQEINKDIEKEIKTIIKDAGANKVQSAYDKVRAIEQYIKTNFNVNEFNIPEASDLTMILKNKYADVSGIVKLYVNIFKMLDIKYNIVLTTNRYKVRFDPNFEAYNYLDKYLLYFPDIDVYLDPENAFDRLGFINYSFTNNYGLFIKEVKLDDYTSGVGVKNFIPPLAYDKNQNNIDITIDFSQGIEEPVIDYTNTFTGMYAQYSQPYYDMLPDDRQQVLNEQMVTGTLKNAHISSVTLENAGSINFGVKPFIIKAKLTSDEYTEKAGNKYLFKVGELIGPQVEMYQKEERHFEVENDYNRWYHREIKFKIPEGYTVSNLDALKMDKFHEADGQRTMTFTSNYSIENNEVKIVVDEYYKQINYPLDLFEKYREVINASADFNKAVIFFEKK